MTERWKEIEGHAGLYSISDWGRVRSESRRVREPRGYVTKERILKQSAAGKGYRKVQLCRGGTSQHRYVHELVLLHFVGPRPRNMEAAHGNGRRDDNRLTNLRWDTRSGNFSDKARHGTATIGERHGRRKLSEADARAIRTAVGSCQEIGKRFGVGPMQVSRIKTGKNWGHIA